MKEHKKYPRRRILDLSVKREFQIWLLIRILGVVVLSTLLAVLVLYFYSRQEISSSFYSAHIEIRRVSDLLFPVMAFGAFVSILGGTILAIFLPQKIAGQIHRVQKSLEAMKDGDLTGNLELRENDILKDLADTVNETAAGLREQIQDVKEIEHQLDRVAASLENREKAIHSEQQNMTLDRLRIRAPNDGEDSSNRGVVFSEWSPENEDE